MNIPDANEARKKSKFRKKMNNELFKIMQIEETKKEANQFEEDFERFNQKLPEYNTQIDCFRIELLEKIEKSLEEAINQGKYSAKVLVTSLDHVRAYCIETKTKFSQIQIYDIEYFPKGSKGRDEIVGILVARQIKRFLQNKSYGYSVQLQYDWNQAHHTESLYLLIKF